MNIFVLDNDIQRCARYHCDAHVSKMILESVQIICTALSSKGLPTPYRPTHQHHPCVIWAGESQENLEWLSRLARALNTEYRYRYQRERDHASIDALNSLAPAEIESKGLTAFAQAMPETYQIPGDAITAYRNFYLAEKAHFARWTRRRPPPWWTLEAGQSMPPPSAKGGRQHG